MKSLHWIIIMVAGLGLFAFAPDEKSEEGIQFFKGTWKEALAESESTGKPIFMDAYTSWCGPCKILKARVFTDPEVGAYFNENFVNVAVDMEKGIGPELARKYKIRAYPTLFVLNADESVRVAAVGYHNPDQLLALGRKALAQENP